MLARPCIVLAFPCFLHSLVINDAAVLYLNISLSKVDIYMVRARRYPLSVRRLVVELVEKGTLVHFDGTVQYDTHSTRLSITGQRSTPCIRGVLRVGETLKP